MTVGGQAARRRAFLARCQSSPSGRRERARARGDRAGGAKGHLDSPRLARPHPPSLPQHALPTAPARAQSPPVWHRPLEVLRRSRTRDCRAFTGVDAFPDEHPRPELDPPRADRAQWQARRTDRPAARTQGLALSRPAAGTDAGSSSSGCRGEAKRQGQASTEAPRTRCVDPPIGPPLRPPSPRHADSYDLAALRNDEQLPLPQKPRARSSTLSLSLRPRRFLRCSRTSPRSGRQSRQRAGSFHVGQLPADQSSAREAATAGVEGGLVEARAGRPTVGPSKCAGRCRARQAEAGRSRRASISHQHLTTLHSPSSASSSSSSSSSSFACDQSQFLCSHCLDGCVCSACPSAQCPTPARDGRARHSHDKHSQILIDSRREAKEGAPRSHPGTYSVVFEEQEGQAFEGCPRTRLVPV
jgi:hypothetical protein